MTVEGGKKYAVQLINSGPTGGAIAAAFVSRITGNEMAPTSPPFGLILFVMKGVAPSDITMGHIYKAGVPFLACDAVTMGLITAFPVLALYLPNLMK